MDRDQKSEVSGQTREGWQAERDHTERIWHYIVGTFSLCGRLGFYTGEITPDVPEKRTKEDCKACIKKLEARAKSDASPQ